jgi:aconitase A
MNEQRRPLTEQEQESWVREQYQSANQHLAERGLLSDRIITKESRYLVPNLAIWKFKLQNGKYVWVINGRVTTDHVSADVAKDAREAMRHFSLNWQLKAENILNGDRAPDETEKKLADVMIRNAEAVYAVIQDERLWPAGQ